MQKANLATLLKKPCTMALSLLLNMETMLSLFFLYKEYQEITMPQSDLVRFLRSYPLVNIELDISRDKNPPREIEL